MARVGCLLIGLCLVVLCGCSSGPTFAKVSGQVLVNGNPAPKVRVEFHPDAAKGSTGPSSVGETDESGRFTLTYVYKDQSGTGAAVGWHKVVVQDLRLAESETGIGVPIRFGPEYSTVLTTPLDLEVKPGEQSLTVAVPKN